MSHHTVTHCHCGSTRGNSDHCPECGCEEFEGFCDHDHAAWIDWQIERMEAAAKWGQEHPFAGACGDDDAMQDQIDAWKAERDSMRR